MNKMGEEKDVLMNKILFLSDELLTFKNNINHVILYITFTDLPA
jgi:hypothetical protein